MFLTLKVRKALHKILTIIILVTPALFFCINRYNMLIDTI